MIALNHSNVVQPTVVYVSVSLYVCMHVHVHTHIRACAYTHTCIPPHTTPPAGGWGYGGSGFVVLTQGRDVRAVCRRSANCIHSTSPSALLCLSTGEDPDKGFHTSGNGDTDTLGGDGGIYHLF